MRRIALGVLVVAACGPEPQEPKIAPAPLPIVNAGISFELDGNGGYSARNFTGGPGTVTFEGNVMTFRGGALKDWHGYTGSTGSGPYVRIRLGDPKEIASSLKLGDAMCYLQH